MAVPGNSPKEAAAKGRNFQELPLQGRFRPKLRLQVDIFGDQFFHIVCINGSGRAGFAEPGSAVNFLLNGFRGVTKLEYKKLIFY